MGSVCEQDSPASCESLDTPDRRATPSANTRLHVLTLTPFFPTQDDDAAGCFVAEPLRWLDLAGIKNTVLAVRPIYRSRVRRNDAVLPAAWIRYLALPGGIGLSTSGRSLYAAVRASVRKLHAQNPLTLIHAHAALPCGHAALLLSRELGIPFVVSVHGRDAFSDRQVTGFAGRWCREISRRVYAGASRVICVSDTVRREVIAAVECRTSVVYNGADPNLFLPDPVNEVSEPIVLSIGNLIAVKGHATLLHAIARLRSDRPVRCQIIGSGPEHTRLAQLAFQLGLGSSVEFLGRRSREDVALALRRCSIFALPSTYEGLGCVYLEAMASGKPVIACTGQGIAEIIETGKNGWLVAPHNPNELTGALQKLLSDSNLRTRLGLAGRHTVMESLTLEHQAKRLASIYQECVQ